MAKIFDADTDAWYEPGQLPPVPQAQKAPMQRGLQLDPSLGMLPMLPFYQPPEEQAQDRALSPLPPVPSMKLDRPAMRPPPGYQPPGLNLGPIPDLGGLPALTTPPGAAAAALQAQPPAPPGLPEGFSWEGQSGRKFELTPEQGARLRAGYADMQKRMGGSLESLGGLDKDPAGTASGLMAALSQFMEPEQAAQLALSVHKGELDRLSAEERQRLALEARAKKAGSGGGAPGGRPPKTTDTNAIFDDVARDFKIQALTQSERDLQQIINMTNSGNALDQRAAIAAKIKEMSGTAASDKEREFYLGSAGFWNSLESKINSYAEGGRLSPELLQQLRTHALSRLDYMRQQRSMAAEAAKRRVDMIGAGREDLKEGFSEYYGGAPKKKPPGDPNAEADELLQ